MGDTTPTDSRSAQPGKSQRRPAANSGLRLMELIGLPTPSCSRRLCPGWSHHMPKARRSQSGLRRRLSHTGYKRDRGAELQTAARRPPRGHFPNDDAAIKLLYLVLNNAAEEWKRVPREWFRGQDPIRRRLWRKVRQTVTKSASRREFLTVPESVTSTSPACHDRLSPSAILQNPQHTTYVVMLTREDSRPVGICSHPSLARGGRQRGTDPGLTHS
jgi:hypothetical protein